MPDIALKSTEQKSAELEVDHFADELGPFVIAAETTRMPMVFTDAVQPGHPFSYANASLLKLSGYAMEEVLGQPFKFMFAKEGAASALDLVEAAFAGDPEDDPEVLCRRKDGSEFWASISISPVKDKSGKLVQHFASFIDLTRYRHEQAQSRLLIDELNHRVKNTLSTVQSIVRQARRSMADPDAIQQAIESRVFALSRSHDLLTQRLWQGVGLADLVRSSLDPFCSGHRLGMRCVLTGENFQVAPKVTLILSIALNELATNAVKYGAFSNDSGAVHVSWTLVSEPAGSRLLLEWEERGGPPVGQPGNRGFGSEIIERGLAHELGAAVVLKFPGDGVLCTIDIPVP